MENTSAATPRSDWLPTASWENLKARSRLLQQIREYFARRGFVEVETPVLSRDTVVDRHLDPFFVDTVVPNRMWLQTSPEFHMKRLMAAGAKAIYQVARVFRHGEDGKFHNPEFTMLEWYRAGDDMKAGVQFLGETASALLSTDTFESISYREAFGSLTGVDPLTSDAAELERFAQIQQINCPWSEGHADRDDWLNLIFSELVQPKLGETQPLIVFDWPASQSALAIVRNEEPPVAERFELFFRGIELANGYHELTDPAELLRRNALVNQQRSRDAKQELPEESRLLDAMRAGLPQCAGVALGIDRLMMAILESSDIADVIAFPADRA